LQVAPRVRHAIYSGAQKKGDFSMEAIQKHRQFLKNDRWRNWDNLTSDQELGLPPPPMQQPHHPGAALIDLVPPERFTLGAMPLIEALARRRSHRHFTAEPLTLAELSFLLWATQGVQRVSADGTSSLRTVPSAGARHPFESYLLVKNVDGLPPGTYRYLAHGHQLCFLRPFNELVMADDWPLYPDEALLLIWTAVPYRTEWRYGILAHKMIAMEAGHICQNLYLAAETIGAGACAVGAFDQVDFDALLAVDGHEEFTIYMARVGKLAAEE